MSEPVLTDTQVMKHQQDRASSLAAEKHTAASPFNAARQSPQLPIKTAGIQIMALREHHCRWPLLRAADEAQEYCGKHCSPNISYCVTHANISYAPSLSRPRVAKEKPGKLLVL